ncbi:MAG: hypothetical protein ACYSTF_10755 [Planctomycetota bacterium]
MCGWSSRFRGVCFLDKKKLLIDFSFRKFILDGQSRIGSICDRVPWAWKLLAVMDHK